MPEWPLNSFVPELQSLRFKQTVRSCDKWVELNFSKKKVFPLKKKKKQMSWVELSQKLQQMRIWRIELVKLVTTKQVWNIIFCHYPQFLTPIIWVSILNKPTSQKAMPGAKGHVPYMPSSIPSMFNFNHQLSKTHILLGSVLPL